MNHIDKLDPFWAAIESDPARDFPRLVLADRLDEEQTTEADTLAKVLRWCCATGRMPRFTTASFTRIRIPNRWLWLRESFGWDLPFTLPSKLFDCFHIDRQVSFRWTAVFETARDAYQAVADAWPIATRKRWFRKAWEPSWDKA